MKTLFASIVLLGSTVGAISVELNSDYQSYIDAKPAVPARTKSNGSKTKPHSASDIDARRFDDGSAIEKPDPLRPGFRNQAGMYVPPDYSTHPRAGGYDGFGSSAGAGSYGSVSSPNPFVGSLGTRR